MFKTILECPNCRNEIALEDARTEIPLSEQSTQYKKVQLVYTRQNMPNKNSFKPKPLRSAGHGNESLPCADPLHVSA